MKIERLDAGEFFERIRESHAWVVEFVPVIREHVLTVIDEDGSGWFYLGPDPLTTSQEAYAAFLSGIDTLPDRVLYRRC